MIFLILIFNLFAQDIIVQSESSSDIEFEQYLLNNPHKKSYSQNYLLKNEHSDELFKFLKKAQYEFLDGSIDKAKENFKKITELRHKDNWNLNQRKTINYAFYRLAQLETSPTLKNKYLKESVIFDASISPEKSLFPPPLVAQFYKIKHSLPSKVWPLPENSSSFKTVIINGEIQNSRQSFIKTSVGEKRFTFISDKFKEITLVTTPSNLKTLKLPFTPLASGSCQSPLFQSSINKEHFFGYYGNQCILPSNIQTLAATEIRKPSEPQLISKKSVWSRNSTWTWIGLTALSAVVAWKVMDNQQSSPSSPQPPLQPTQTYISNSRAND